MTLDYTQTQKRVGWWLHKHSPVVNESRAPESTRVSLKSTMCCHWMQKLFKMSISCITVHLIALILFVSNLKSLKKNLLSKVQLIYFLLCEHQLQTWTPESDYHSNVNYTSKKWDKPRAETNLLIHFNYRPLSLAGFMIYFKWKTSTPEITYAVSVREKKKKKKYLITKSWESISGPQLLFSRIPEFPTMAQRLWCWFFMGDTVGKRR